MIVTEELGVTPPDEKKIAEADAIVQESKSANSIRLDESPETPAPKRRGRPPGSKNKPKGETPAEPKPEPVPIPPFLVDVVGKAYGGVFDVLAVRAKNDIWKLTPEERENLGRLTIAVVSKYMSYLKDYPEEIALALCLITVVGTRMNYDPPKATNGNNANTGQEGKRENDTVLQANAGTDKVPDSRSDERVY